MHSHPVEFQEFVEFATERLRELSSRKSDPQWANDAKRLAQVTGEVLMTASFEVQDTHLFTDLKLTHERLLKLMALHANLIDGESSRGNRFDEW